MKQQALLIDLLDDCVFSARSATEGAHESLDYIPGSALLGAVAAELYSGLNIETAFAAFHSGQLRFGNGLPWNGNSVGWPMPYVWHHAKNEKPAEDGRLQENQIFKGSQVGNNRQAKQLRSGFVHENGQWSRPNHSLHMKTAIDSQTGRASEGQLFGYDALHKGQRFVSFLEADDGFDSAVF
ncbi:MAG: hypothetical protein KZQ58_08975 [gamma proteobacterium symbiont of Bathyaustriella thionipta]|nr:hypothetical protein [gamma proteobacterium symbiont of Bathyaustriella thionipta]